MADPGDIITNNPTDFGLCVSLTPRRKPRNSYKYALDEVNEMGETWLLIGLKYAHCNATIFDMLISDNDVNIASIDGTTPLHLAVTRATDIVTGWLISRDANINARNKVGDTPLHMAVRHSRLTNVMKLLRQCDIRYDAKNDAGETPLYLAMSTSYRGPDNRRDINYPIVTALLNRGCDINLCINKIRKYTVLHYALQQREMNLAQMLIQRGANVHAEDTMGMTPVHYAVCYNTDDVLYMLLYYGASGNTKDREGRTPLELALKRGKMEIAEYLMLYTYNFNERNSLGMTLLHTAIRYRSTLAFQMLESGADVNLTFNERDCLTLSLLTDDRMFEAIWPRIDIVSFLPNRYEGSSYHPYGSILEMFTHSRGLPAKQFLKYFYMVFESQNIDDIIYDHTIHTSGSLLLNDIHDICDYNLPIKDKLRISYLFFYHNINIYYEDVQCIFEAYGFDEYVELLLKQGIRYPRLNPHFAFNPLFCMIWYNYFPALERAKKIPQALQVQYRQYFRANFEIRFNFQRNNRPYVVTEVPSLLQLTRDAIREAMYRRWSTSRYFKVYQMFSELPTAPGLRNVLYLREPLYKA